MHSVKALKGVGLTLGIAMVLFGITLGFLGSASASSVALGTAQPAASNSTSSSSTSDIGTALYTLAASIAIAGGLIGTGMAQSGIGAAGMGIIAERPEKFGSVLVFFVIPETLWIIGLVLGFLLLLKIF